MARGFKVFDIIHAIQCHLIPYKSKNEMGGGPNIKLKSAEWGLMVEIEPIRAFSISFTYELKPTCSKS